MEYKEYQKNCSDTQDSGVTNVHNSKGSNVDTNPLAFNRQEDNNNTNDSGNVSGDSAGNKNVVHNAGNSNNERRTTVFQDHPAAEMELFAECNAAFSSDKGLESDSPFRKNDEQCSEYSSSSSSFCIKQENKSINNVDFGEYGISEIFGGKSGNYKAAFIPGDNCLPIYSSDYRNVFAHMMRGDTVIGPLRTNSTNFYHTGSFQSGRTRNPFGNPITNRNLNVPAQTKTAASHSSVSNPASNMINSQNQHIPIDLLYKLLPEKKNDDCKCKTLQMMPEMVPKVLFDKLARELVKVKSESISLGNKYRQLQGGFETLLQQFKRPQHCQRSEGMCEMDVELPSDDKRSIPENVATSPASIHNTEQELDAEVGPVSIDIQRAKEIEDLTGTGSQMDDCVLRERLKDEMRRRTQIEQKLQESESLLKVEKERAQRLVEILSDEKKRFLRDNQKLLEQVKKYRSKERKESSSESSRRNSSPYPTKSERFSSSGVQPSSVDKSQYVGQGAIPKR